MAVAVVAEGAAVETRPVVGELHENRPDRGVLGEDLEAFVEGEAVRVAGEVAAVEVGAEFGRPLLGRHADIAIGGLLGGFELFFAEHIPQVQIAGQVEEVALFGAHHSADLSMGVWVSVICA